MELRVHVTTDIPDEIDRQDYIRWAVYSVFLPMQKEFGGCGGCPHSACSAVVHTLLKEDMQR